MPPDMPATEQSIANILEQFGQEHLLRFWPELTEQQQQDLQAQIQQIDFQTVQDNFAKFGSTETWAELAKRAEPPAAVRLSEEHPDYTREDATEAGRNALKNGQVAMILVAGGQGSRLGFDKPKGMFQIGPVSGRTLFQFAIDKLLGLRKRYGATIPLYVMTSPATHAETESYFQDNDYLGYDPNSINFFCQGTMPAVDDATGKILLAEKDQIALSPDGHGGMLSALDRNGCLADMVNRGIEQVFYCQIDNPMVQVCDATTVGFHILAQSQLTAQAVPKSRPLQKVGNIVSIDGKTQIIEYSDLPDEIAEQRNADGSLRLWTGNIAVHVFDVGFLDQMKDRADALPIHLAHKKVAHLDRNGESVTPEQPNAIKFERFIFDLLPMAENSLVVEVDPAEAFSPVKNAADQPTETAATAQQTITNQARRWVRAAGGSVDDDTAVEVSPLYALDQSEFVDRVGALAFVAEPTFFAP